MSLWARVATTADLPAVFALRHEVFVVEQGVDPAIERDELDATAVHAYVWDDAASDRLVATGRLLSRPPDPARIGRMAVRADARGRGAGTVTLRLLERQAVRRGHTSVVLHAQVHARPFYERFGYQVTGHTFVEAGIEHVEMRRDFLAIRPVRDSDSAALIELIGSAWAEYPGMVLDVDAEEPWMRAPATAYATWGGRMWVAEVDGQVVASIGVKPSGASAETVELKSLYVAASARRHGLGELLTGLVEDEAFVRGAKRVELWSDTRLTDAHRFYARLGYTQLPQTRELHDLSNTIEFAFAKQLPGYSLGPDRASH